MKKLSTWAGIVGGLLVIVNLLIGVRAFNNLTGIPILDVAILGTHILYILLGAFFIFVFFKLKHKEDVNIDHEKPIPNSPEDIQLLMVKRSWVIGLLLVITAINSAQVWILNDYRTGLTPINITVIFDILFNAAFLYFAFELLRGKWDIARFFLYVAGLYALGYFALNFWRGDNIASLVLVIWVLYFGYAILLPQNRRNFRTAHFLILPLFLVSSLLYIMFAIMQPLEPLFREKDLLAQQYANNTSRTGTAYGVFIQRDLPIEADIRELRDSVTERKAKIQAIYANFDRIEQELATQLPTIETRKMLERIALERKLLAVHQEEMNKILEFVDYVKGLNFFLLTDEQRDRIAFFKSEVAAFTDRLTEFNFKMQNSNLGFSQSR